MSDYDSEIKRAMQLLMKGGQVVDDPTLLPILERARRGESLNNLEIRALGCWMDSIMFVFASTMVREWAKVAKRIKNVL